MKKSKKGFMDFSFTWIFAILVGAMILFGAFYGVNKFREVKELESSGQAALTLNSLLNPLETGIESSIAQEIRLTLKSRISNKCDSDFNFGSQLIRVEEEINHKWSKGLEVSFQNKYLFFPSRISGQEFYVFSNSFEFPFKIGNLMYLTNKKEKFCFENAPSKIGKELDAQDQSNFIFKSDISECPDYSTKICFSSNNILCNVTVDTNQKRVIKNGEEMYYETNALLYGAIFSDKNIYECELKRLMYRAKQLSKLYKLKSINLRNIGCSSSLSQDLDSIINLLENYQNSYDLATMNFQLNQINQRNKNSQCRLW